MASYSHRPTPPPSALAGEVDVAATVDAATRGGDGGGGAWRRWREREEVTAARVGRRRCEREREGVG